MSSPLVILCGRAGSGKDTVAQILAEEYGAGCLAIADPMKRYCREVFGFAPGVLWGESSLRSTLHRVDPPGAIGAGRDFERAQRFALSLGVHEDGAEGLLAWERRCRKWAEHGGLTPRHALQTLGTEWGRSGVGLGESLWIGNAIVVARQIVRGASYDRETGIGERGKPRPFAVITDGRFPNEILAVKEAGGIAVLIESSEVSTDTHASERGLDDVPVQWFDAIVANDKSAGLRALRRAVVGLFADLMDARVAIPERRPEDQEQ